MTKVLNFNITAIQTLDFRTQDPDPYLSYNYTFVAADPEISPLVYTFSKEFTVNFGAITGQYTDFAAGMAGTASTVIFDAVTTLNLARNTFFGTTDVIYYTDGEFIEFTGLGNEIVKEKQPLSENLNEFADIALASDVKAMLQASDLDGVASTLAAPLATAMLLDTAAFKPVVFFAAASAMSGKVDTTTTVNGHALTGNVTVAYADLSGKPTLFSGAYTDLTGKPTLFSGSYLDLTNKPTIPAAQIQSDWNQASTGALDYIKNKPSISASSYANPSRSLNTAFQISSTREATVSYSVDISCTMSLTSGQSGVAYLEYADDSGFTTNVKTVARGPSGNSGALTIGLALTSLGAVNLVGRIPAGKYVRIRTSNTTGTPTFTLQNAQEVML